MADPAELAQEARRHAVEARVAADEAARSYRATRWIVVLTALNFLLQIGSLLWR